MKRIDEIDAFFSGRPPLSEKERANLNRARVQQHKEDGYQHLTELCRLGEYEAARQLANRNRSWGYEIVGEEVIDMNK
ncbi:hypothetical protein NDI44_27380 [Trichocoleus sp. DQ-A3]|uniref:hypothetical protein n=1 Tax=Cyanophyceae TaxID=3028117 RepID=UPI00168A2852|nr:hypothetical protein [Coleofasciculus sp. FACHB-125]MBD1903714.1 hypothetical protein [Coleofasciculus sp. FACHB-125]